MAKPLSEAAKQSLLSNGDARQVADAIASRLSPEELFAVKVDYYLSRIPIPPIEALDLGEVGKALSARYAVSPKLMIDALESVVVELEAEAS